MSQITSERSLMYSRKIVGPRMKSWGTPALTGYYCEDLHFPSRSTSITEKRRDRAKYLTWNSMRLTFVKKTSMPNLAKSLGYIKRYGSSSPRPVKSPSNSIRYSCKNIYSWSRRQNHTGNLKKDHIALGDQQVYFLQLFQRLLTAASRLIGL